MGEVDIEKTTIYLKCLSNLLGVSELDEFTIVKLTYLIQEWGLDLGYRYGWFIYNPLRFEGPFTIGPYSTQLLYYIDEIKDKMSELKEGCDQISEDEEYRLKSIAGLIKYFMQKNKGLRGTLHYILEMLTSLHFTFNYSGMPGSDEEKIKRLLEVKGELEEKDLIEALELMRKIFQSSF